MKKSETRNGVSIHVPRVGDDDCLFFHPWDPGEFLSTSPAWGTTVAIRFSLQSEVFLSTSPAWGTTLLRCELGRDEIISIHVPRVGDDRRWASYWRHCGQHFYPRPPRGGRQGGGEQCLTQPYFYPRPPRGGRPRESVVCR